MNQLEDCHASEVPTGPVIQVSSGLRENPSLFPGALLRVHASSTRLDLLPCWDPNLGYLHHNLSGRSGEIQVATST